MDNPVVVHVARALAAAGLAALRFNFGGAGASEGAYGQGREEQRDVAAATVALAARIPEGSPLAIAGYSFGAWVGTLAAQELPRVARVVAVAPPLAFFAWELGPRLRQPLDVVVGDRDQYCPADALERFVAAYDVRAEVIPGADHFLDGLEARVAAAVVRLVGGA